MNPTIRISNEFGAVRDRPVRRGLAYCSPGCGGGPVVCSVVRYQNVKSAVERVCRDLGSGWTGELHHNLGWHGHVGSPCGRVWLSIDFDLNRDPSSNTITGYHAFLGPPRAHGGSGKWAEDGNTPRKAIEAVLARAMGDLGVILTITTGLIVPPANRGTCPRCGSEETNRVTRFGRPLGNEYQCLRCKRRWEAEEPAAHREAVQALSRNERRKGK